jgi:hypothetical protein
MTISSVASNKVFISYRRDDSAGHAGRVLDRLVSAFGRDAVFMDIASIPYGADFVDKLDADTAKCSAALAIIGPRWLDARDEKGNRRLDSEHDLVRIEIAAVLKRNILVIPILLDGTHMPNAEQLPADLKALARRNALDIRSASFNADVANIVSELSSIIGERTSQPTAIEGERFITLWEAIDWIASQGGKKFDPDRDTSAEEMAVVGSQFPVRKWLTPRGKEMAEAYRNAVEELMHAAFEERIIVKGFRAGDSSVVRQVVPNDCFENVKAMGWPFCPEALDYDCLVDDKNHHLEFTVREGGDRIVKGDKILWSGLLCERADVVNLWPAGDPKANDA